MKPIHFVLYYLALVASIACPPLLMLTVPVTVVLIRRARQRRLERHMAERELYGILVHAQHTKDIRQISSTWRTS